MGHREHARWRNRGQTGPLGLILVFSIMIASTTAIVAFGLDSLDSSQERLEISSAETAMTQLDSKIALVGLGSSSVQQVDLPKRAEGGYTVDPTAGRIEVTSALHGTILDAEMGALVYESGGTTVAYQGGGVWRSSGNNSLMVSPPEFHYRDATLTLPIVTFSSSSDRSIDSRAAIEKTTVVQEFPKQGTLRSNPIPTGSVTVTVESKYYHAWGRYFENRADGSVTYDHANDRATIQLVVPTNNPPVAAGITTGAPSSTLDIKQSALVDSYDSGSGSYLSTNADQGTVTTAGDISLKNNAEILGDVEISGSLDMKTDSVIHGDLTHSGSVTYTDPKTDHVDGTISTGASVSAPTSVEGVINLQEDRFDDSADNDNDQASTTISNLESGSCDVNTCKLEDGDYYLSNIDLNNDGDATTPELTLDTTNGDITIVVNGDFDMDSDAKLEVTDTDRVDIYMMGDFDMGQGATIDIPDDRSPQFWLFMKPGNQADIGQSAVFQGVIYGPGSGGGTGTAITVNNNGEVYGGLVGDVGDLKNGQQVHFDSALETVDVLNDVPSVPSVTYLHVSEHEIKVEG